MCTNSKCSFEDKLGRSAFYEIIVNINREVFFILVLIWPTRKPRVILDKTIRLVLGTNRLGHDSSWVRVVLYELSWVRFDLSTIRLGYDSSWVLVVLGTSCLGYELVTSGFPVDRVQWTYLNTAAVVIMMLLKARGKTYIKKMQDSDDREVLGFCFTYMLPRRTTFESMR